ncbi:MAG: PQQ-binding-like beta-propeller repeat protein, partial [bacterium]|nr:PQQ-binding-like beta-propeller repeat protein [bacterium]
MKVSKSGIVIFGVIFFLIFSSLAEARNYNYDILQIAQSLNFDGSFTIEREGKNTSNVHQLKELDKIIHYSKPECYDAGFDPGWCKQFVEIIVCEATGNHDIPNNDCINGSCGGYYDNFSKNIKDVVPGDILYTSIPHTMIALGRPVLDAQGNPEKIWVLDSNWCSSCVSYPDYKVRKHFFSLKGKSVYAFSKGWEYTLSYADHSNSKSAEDPITLAPGEAVTITIKWKNEGREPWNNDPSNPTNIYLAVSEDSIDPTQTPPTGHSSFAHNTWVDSDWKVCYPNETTIEKGGIATFHFSIQAPTTPGEYKEYFYPYHVSGGWVPDRDTQFKPVRISMIVQGDSQIAVGEGAPNGDISQKFISVWEANSAQLGTATGTVESTTSVLSGVEGYYQLFKYGSIQYINSGSQAGEAYALYGKLYEKWGDLGYADSLLGFPTDNRIETTSSFNTSGTYQIFEGGSIQLNTLHPFAVYGEVYAKWSSVSYAAGALGFPISDRIQTTSGFGTEGYYQLFEGGSIQVHSGNSYAVSGLIYQEWGRQGYATWVGFPTSDRYSCSGGECQDFEGGYIQSDGQTTEFVSNTHPTNLTAEVSQDGAVNLSWENRVLANGISVFRTGSPTERIAVLAPDATSFVDDTVVAGHSYTYFVQAYHNTAESPNSNAVMLEVSSNPETHQKIFFSGNGTVNDGFIFNHGFNDYLTLQSAQTANEVSNPAYTTMLIVGQDKAASGEYYVYRASIPFDTGLLPDNCTITGATLYLYGYDADYSYTDFDIEIVQSNQASVSSLALSDFGSFGTTSGGSLNSSNWQDNNGINSITFNATGLSWINKGGATKIGFRSSRDISQTTPTQHEFVNIWSSESGSSYKPYLVIEYTESSGGLDNGPWPIFGHDLRHTRRSPYVGKDATLKWQYQTGSDVFSSLAIGSEGTIYVGSNDNYLYAVNPDGILKWRYQTGDDVISSPAIGSEGTIYVGSSDNYLYAINSDGTRKWRYQAGGGVTSSPAISDDGVIYVGSADGYLYAINPDGTRKWRYQTGGGFSSPAIGDDGTIYVGSWDNYLYAINLDGTRKWRYQTGGSVGSSPAIGSDGTIYVGTRNNYLYAINPDGTRKWRYQTGGGVGSSPAIGSDGTIYVGSQDNYLYAINPDGTRRWRYQTGGHVDSSPAIDANGTIYIGSDDNYLYAINSNGTLKWRYQTGGDLFSSPAIGADGTIYIGNFDGYLYAIGGISAPDISVSPASHNFGSVNIGNSSDPQTFTISNTGDADLVIGTITLTGTDASAFSIQNNNYSGQTLAPSATCPVDVVFSPVSAGLKSASLFIASNNPDTPALDVSLSGEGVSSEPQVTVTRTLPQSYSSDTTIEVNLTIDVNESNKPNEIIIREYIPANWTAISSTPDSVSFNPSTGEVKWLFYDSEGILDQTTTYRVQIPANESGIKTFEGDVLCINPEGTSITSKISGDTQTSSSGVTVRIVAPTEVS